MLSGMTEAQDAASRTNLMAARVAQSKRKRRRDFRAVRELIMEALESFRHPTEDSRGAAAFFKWTMNQYPRDFIRLIAMLYPRDVKVSGNVTARIGVALQSDNEILQRVAGVIEIARRRAIELGTLPAGALPAPEEYESEWDIPANADMPQLTASAVTEGPEEAE